MYNDRLCSTLQMNTRASSRDTDLYLSDTGSHTCIVISHYMSSYLVGLEALTLALTFIYILTLCLRAAGIW